MSDVIIRLRDCSFRYRQADADFATGRRGRRAPAGCPFSVLVAMDPTPERAALASGGLLSHLHFQYASDDGMLLRADSTLRKRMWYPTMCAAEDTLRDQCDIVRTLHKLPPLDREA